MTMVSGPGETISADSPHIKAANRGGSMGRAKTGMGDGQIEQMREVLEFRGIYLSSDNVIDNARIISSTKVVGI